MFKARRFECSRVSINSSARFHVSYKDTVGNTNQAMVQGKIEAKRPSHELTSFVVAY